MKKLLLVIIFSSLLSAFAFAQSRAISVSDPYPNPSISAIKFDYSSQINDPIKLKIYNIIGKELESINLHYQKGSVKLNIASYSPGVYFFAFQVNDRTLHTGKFYVKN